jgi:hypothetical protein
MLVTVALGGVCLAGCATPDGPGGSASGQGSAELATLQIPGALPAGRMATSTKRHLLFTVTGIGAVPEDLPQQEAKLAGIEAALVDAVGRIVCSGTGHFQLVEGELAEGNFAVKVADNLVLRGSRSVGQPAELELLLDDRGRTTRLHVVDGRLSHPPYGPTAVAKVLSATGGAMKLLYTGWADEPQHYCVQLGYYRAEVASPVGSGAENATVAAGDDLQQSDE